MLKLFVDAGVNVNIEEKDIEGRNLLFRACMQNNPDAVQALCENGADMLLQNKVRYSPLLYTLRYNQSILAIFRSHVLHNHIFTHPHTDSVPNLNLFVTDKVENQAFLFFGLMHPLSKWEVREYMDVVGCVRNGVRGIVKKYGLIVGENEERRGGLRLFVRRIELPLDLQRWLLFWEAENAFSVSY